MILRRVFDTIHHDDPPVTVYHNFFTIQRCTRRRAFRRAYRHTVNSDAVTSFYRDDAVTAYRAGRAPSDHSRAER